MQQRTHSTKMLFLLAAWNGTFFLILLRGVKCRMRCVDITLDCALKCSSVCSFYTTHLLRSNELGKRCRPLLMLSVGAKTIVFDDGYIVVAVLLCLQWMMRLMSITRLWYSDGGLQDHLELSANKNCHVKVWPKRNKKNTNKVKKIQNYATFR